MRMILAQLRRVAADERGFTMVTVMGVLLIATLFSVAAIAAADRDIPQSRADVDRKQAYSAAEAGINDYMARLNQDSNYWTNCASVPAPAPVNQQFKRTSPGQADPRKWRQLPGSTEAAYTIELIPAPGQTTCDPADAATSMIDPATGGFTIRATGRSSAAGTGTPVYRTITTRFRRRGFLDFLYFTDLETSDPEFFAGTSNYAAMQTECKKYKRNGRASPPCSEISFVTGDQVNGPLHTNDRLLIAGRPEFGRDKDDRIEVVAKDGAAAPDGPAWEPNGSGNPEPWRGTFVPSAPRMDLPPSNSELANVAGTVLTGDTELTFNGSTITVRNKNLTPTAPYTSTLSMTDPNFNGVIYVKNGTCSAGGTMRDPYPDPDGSGPLAWPSKDEGCGNAWVSGSYDRSVTIAAENHIIIRPDKDPGSGPAGKGIRRNGSAMMGLIANQFIRVYHPVTGTAPCDGSDSNASGWTDDVQIDAAILSLNHSFTVDNYWCGARMGVLTVNGAIAQKHRGPVGTFGGSGTGYTKNYSYDDRLLYRAPPYFLDPVQSAWRTVKHTEQIPASK